MTEFSTKLECAYFPTCSGCDDQQNALHPPIWQEVIKFFSPHPIHLIHQEITGWRMRAKLAVRGTPASPQIGLFKRGTHAVVPIPTCPLHHPSINRACDVLIKSNISPYNEEKNQGVLRYLQFTVEKRSRRVQLVLVVNQSHSTTSLERWVKQLYMEGGFHSIWLNFQPHSSNTIFGKQWQLCEGEPYIEQKIADCVFSFHPACFMQAHLSLFERLIRSIQQRILPHKKVFDLYSGVGVIGLNLASLSNHITCIESNPFAAECFHLSRLRLSPELQKKVDFQEGEVLDYLPQIQEAEVLILDPPRKGLDPNLRAAILSSPNVYQIIYISCNPLSFFRDCEVFLNAGWKIAHAEGYLLFPGSNHVEILCFLTLPAPVTQ